MVFPVYCKMKQQQQKNCIVFHRQVFIWICFFLFYIFPECYTWLHRTLNFNLIFVCLPYLHAFPFCGMCSFSNEKLLVCLFILNIFILTMVIEWEKDTQKMIQWQLCQGFKGLNYLFFIFILVRNNHIFTESERKIKYYVALVVL